MDRPVTRRRRPAAPASAVSEAGAATPPLLAATPRSAALLAAAPAATVAICTFQRYDLLERTLAAVAGQAVDAFEILLIDNAPDPDRSLVEYRRHRHLPRLRWVHEPQKGLSYARNRALAEAASPIVAFLDDDAVPDPGWLQALLEGFDLFGDDAMAIGGRVSPLWLGARPAWLGEQLLPYLSITDLGESARLLQEHEWIVGANMALRQRVFDTLGGFPVHLGRKGDGGTLLSNDETPVFRDIRARGGLIGYVPRASVSHLIDPARLSQAWFRRRLAWQAVSDYLDDPATSRARAEQSWDWLTSFLVRLPPSLRSYRGLLTDMASAELLEQQLNAVYNASACLLNGVDLDAEDPFATPRTEAG